MDAVSQVQPDLNDYELSEGSAPSIFEVFNRHKFIVALMLIIGLALGYLYYSKQQPVYMSTAKVMVTQTIPMSVDGSTNSQFQRQQSLVLGLNTQLKIIQSPIVVGPAVDGSYASDGLGDADELLKKVDQETGENQDILDNEDRVFEDLRKRPSLAGLSNPASRVSQGLDVKQDGNSEILILSYKGTNRDDCPVILNAVAESYQHYLKGKRDRIMREAKGLIKRAHEDLEKQIKDLQADYQKFRSNHSDKLLKVGEDGQNIHQARQSSIEMTRSDVLLERSQVFAQLQSTRSALENGGDREALLLLIQQPENSSATTAVVDPQLDLAEKRILQTESDIDRNDQETLKVEQRLAKIEQKLLQFNEAERNVTLTETKLKQNERHSQANSDRLKVVGRLKLELGLQDVGSDESGIEAQLLPILQEHQTLSNRYGSDHPKVKAVQKNLEMARAILRESRLEERQIKLEEERSSLEEQRTTLEDDRVVMQSDLKSYQQIYTKLATEIPTLKSDQIALEKERTKLSIEAGTLKDELQRQRVERDKIEASIPEDKGEGDGPSGLATSKKTPARDVFEIYLKSLEQRIATSDSKLKQLDSMFESEEQQAKSMETFESEDAIYRADIARKQQLYDVVIKRLDELDLTEGLGGFEATVVNGASAAGLIEPQLFRIMPVAAILGLMVGMGLAYGVELADKRFRSPEDIRRDLQLPLLGHIPQISTDKSLKTKESLIDATICTHHKPRSSTSESYRSVRTSLFFSAAGENAKVIQVTSPCPGDGKSTLAGNLAASIAQSGKRVLLIDADFRKPRVHKLFNLNPEVGLATVINGSTKISNAIQPCDVKNLYLLPCGPRPHNPAELLSSQRFQKLLDQLREMEKLDYIIIDTPPVLAVTDPSNVAPRVDGVLLVLRINKRSRANAMRATQILNDLGAETLGIVVNGIGGGRGKGYGYGGYGGYGGYRDSRYGGYGYGGYGYGGYGYGDVGYGDEVEDDPVLRLPPSPQAARASTSNGNGSATNGNGSASNGSASKRKRRKAK